MTKSPMVLLKAQKKSERWSHGPVGRPQKCDAVKDRPQAGGYSGRSSTIVQCAGIEPATR